MGRFSQYAVHASDQAIKDAGLDLETEDRERVGVLIGSGAGGCPRLMSNQLLWPAAARCGSVRFTSR